MFKYLIALIFKGPTVGARSVYIFDSCCISKNPSRVRKKNFLNKTGSHMKFKLNNKKRNIVKGSGGRDVWVCECASGCSGRKCFTAPSDRQTDSDIFSFHALSEGLRHDGRET